MILNIDKGITFESVNHFCKLACLHLKQNDLEVNFTESHSYDSTSIAFLLTTIQQATKNNRIFRYNFLPSHVAQLADIYMLRSFLEKYQTTSP